MLWVWRYDKIFGLFFRPDSAFGFKMYGMSLMGNFAIVLAFQGSRENSDYPWTSSF